MTMLAHTAESLVTKASAGVSKSEKIEMAKEMRKKGIRELERNKYTEGMESLIQATRLEREIEYMCDENGDE